MTRRRPSDAPAPPITRAHHAAILIELRRLTLGGQPQRPELVSPITTNARLFEVLQRATSARQLREPSERGVRR